MTEREIVESVKSFAGKKTELKQTEDLSGFLRIMVRESVTDRVWEAVDPDSEAAAFGNWKINRICSLGRKKLVEILIADLGEAKKTQIKDFAQSLVLAARYLAGFNGMQGYKKHLSEITKSDHEIVSLMDDFKKESGVFGMTIFKATRIFALSGLLDVPVYSKEIKDFLRSELNLPDINSTVYSELLKIQRLSGLTGLQTSDAISSLISKS